MCDFIGSQSNFRSLSRFKDIASFVLFPCTPIPVKFRGVSFGIDSEDPRLSSREIIFKVFQPMRSSYLNVTQRRTDRWTGRGDTALCVASRGKLHI